MNLSYQILLALKVHHILQKIYYQKDQLREMLCIDLLLGHVEKSIAVETLYFS